MVSGPHGKAITPGPGQAEQGPSAEVLIEDGGIQVHGTDVGPVEDPLGQPVAGLVRGGLLAAGLQPLRKVHDLLDTSLLHRVGEVGPADTAYRGCD